MLIHHYNELKHIINHSEPCMHALLNVRVSMKKFNENDANLIGLTKLKCAHKYIIIKHI